ncbi:MAG: enoyl-CoA hydratase/isomerase family protein [Cumulibacter sp.]
MTDVNYEVVDHVGVLTLNRPEVHNALRHETYDELTELVAGCTERALIITGADPSFCAGDDVRAILGVKDKPKLNRPMTPAAGALLATNVPVIAAVNGAAVGWGMELALLADMRVASEKAKFGELFVKRGLVSDVAGIGRLASLVGRERAAELLFTGEIISAERAAEIGLVGRVVPHEQLLESALELANKIAANPPLAVAALKDGLRRTLDPNWHDLGLFVRDNLNALFATEDHREGVASFMEKREPVFKGR